MRTMASDSQSSRIRGKAGVILRQYRRTQHPLCECCLAKGITTATAELDHVMPLSEGGEDVDENIQGLCQSCHAAKTTIKPTTGIDGWPIEWGRGDHIF